MDCCPPHAKNAVRVFRMIAVILALALVTAGAIAQFTSRTDQPRQAAAPPP